MCDPEDFDSANYLKDWLMVNAFPSVLDPFFNPNALPTYRLPYQFKRHSMMQLVGVPKCMTKSLRDVEPVQVTVGVVFPDSQRRIATVEVVNLLEGADACLVDVLEVRAEMEGAVVKEVVGGGGISSASRRSLSIDSLAFHGVEGNLYSIEAVDIVDVETVGVVELRKFIL
ncbi:hypothetical protein HDU98_010976 [Podochytrium sp. JEL0797]|nr:hypothetical protein HDU98_010976 [Podochytrium sp. JEL0797]